MKTVQFTITSASPLVYGKPIFPEKVTGESAAAVEERTWQDKVHATSTGQCYIPANAVKLMLSSCAKFLSESVPGKGKATYTKHFESGVAIFEDILLNKNTEDLERLKMYVPSDGLRGGTKRVWKSFPLLNQWQGTCTIVLTDPILSDNTPKVEEYLKKGGKSIGLLTFRPRNGGTYGRFNISNFQVISE